MILKIKWEKRELLFDVIIENCHVGVGVVNEKDIDNYNILNATFMGMIKAIEDISEEGISFENVLVDGNHKIREYNNRQTPIIKGDGKSLAIAAASIIAKVTRDRIMVKYDEKYPEYGFAKHKGYGTKQHREAILKNGACQCHRKTFLGNILKPTLF